MDTKKPLPPKIQTLFAKTRVLCFGRYAITVPEDAEIEFQEAEVYTAFKTYPNQADTIEGIINAKWEKLLLSSSDKPIILHNVKNAPVAGAHYVWFYEDTISEKHDSAKLYAAIPAGQHAYTYYDWGNAKNNTIPVATQKFAQFAKALRARENTDVPKDAGYCIDWGFVAEQTYQYQETVSVGFFFPSMPDVRFNVNSNQMAYSEYSLEDYAKEQSLYLFEERRKQKGENYGYEALRVGKRQLHHWTGEEILLKSKKNNLFHFEWSNVSKPGGAPGSPSGLEITFRTGGQTNPREEKPIPLKDEEAMALFDQLLEGFKYRVRVPGAPPEAVMFP